MNWDREYLTKTNIASILQRYYESIDEKTSVGPIPAKFLVSDLKHALLAAPPAPIDYKFDKELVLAHLKRLEQEVYNSAGVPQEYFGGLKQVFQKAEEEILNEASPTT